MLSKLISIYISFRSNKITKSRNSVFECTNFWFSRRRDVITSTNCVFECNVRLYLRLVLVRTPRLMIHWRRKKKGKRIKKKKKNCAIIKTYKFRNVTSGIGFFFFYKHRWWVDNYGTTTVALGYDELPRAHTYRDWPESTARNNTVQRLRIRTYYIRRRGRRRGEMRVYARRLFLRQQTF